MRVNNDADLRALFDGTPEVAGLNIIYSALLHDTMIILTRLFDGGRNLDRSDKASLRVVLHFLNDKAVIRALVEDARGWLPGLEEESAKAAAKALLRAKVRLTNLTSHEPGCGWLRRMRDYRNEFLAHSLVGIGARERPTFGHIGELLRATLPIIQDLQLGVRGTNRRWREFDAEAERISTVFWDSVARGR